MSMPPPSPLERQSLYPEAHRVGEWPIPIPARRSRFIPILSLVGVLLLLVGAIQFGLTIGRNSGTKVPVVTNPDGVEINAIQVEAGTCLVSLPEDGAVARVTAVPCDTPHQAEAVSSYALTGDAWPGDDKVRSKVLDHCGSFIQPGYDIDSMFKTSDWEDGLRWVAWLPTEESWGANERSGVCVVHRDEDIIGSFVAGTAIFTD